MTTLDADAVVAGVRLVSFDTIDSTNAEALRRGRAGEHGPLWIVARGQTSGRGRRGRQWVSEPGNFHATLLLPRGGAADISQLSFIAALAVHDAIETLTSLRPPALQLKWPNDVLLDDRKVAGILLEADSAAGEVIAMGIGVNCAHHPEATEFPASDLMAAGFAVLPQHLLKTLSSTMLKRLGQWNLGAGFAAIRAEWLSRAHGLGRPVRARLSDRSIDGCFETLDERGRLVLRRPDGSAEIVTAADVFPLAVGD